MRKPTTLNLTISALTELIIVTIQNPKALSIRRDTPKTTRLSCALFTILFVAAIAAMPKAACAQIFVTNAGTSDNSSFYIPGSGTIGKYTNSGAMVNSALVSGLNAPAGIALSGDKLFVTNYGTYTNGKYNLGSGSVGEYTTSGTTVNSALISGLSEPFGIAVSGADLFVVKFGTYTNGNYNLGSGTIGEYTTSGATVNAALVSGLSGPYGIAVSGDNLFVTNFISGTIGEYTSSGATVNASLISGLNNGPIGIAVSGANLFVTNYGTITNGKYDLGSGSVGQYSTSGATVHTALLSLNWPTGIAVSGANLFVVDRLDKTISQYTTSGTTVNASLVTGFSDPIGVVVVPEPSTWAMLSIGAISLAVVSVRRRMRK